MGTPEHGHSRCPQVEDGGAQVDPGEDGRKPGEGQGHQPQVGAGSRRVGGVGQWGVGHPAEAGGPAGDQESGHHGDRSAQVEPVGQGIQAGKGHVRCAHLQRHDVVGQTSEGEGPGKQVEHEAAVHGEQLVVGLEETNEAVGVVSWARMTRAMMPAMKKSTSEVIM